MGTFTFTWDHPASEVFVTGTFDHWSKSEQLQQSGNSFSKTVELPHSSEPIYYKFVVDGQWTTDHTAASETDSTGNLNNVLHPHDITHADKATAGAPQSETPGESDVPGGFPVTPALNSGNNTSTTTNAQSTNEDASFFGVSPLPATAGTGNPVKLAPGEKLPETSSITTNTVNSGVRLDKASYEKSDSGPPVLPNPVDRQNDDDVNGAHMFNLPPVGGTMIPESSLPMGDANKSAPRDNGPFIQSTGPTSTTAHLAGQAPIEPRGVPTIVSDSQHEAHVDPEASATSRAVQRKDKVEDELVHSVPKAPATSTSESGLINDNNQSTQHSGIKGKVTGAAAAAGAAVAAAAVRAQHKTAGATGQDADRVLPASIQNSIEKINNSAQGKTNQTTASSVPAMVTESQQRAHVGPEAAASAEAVREKSEVERELERTVQPALASATLTAPASTDAASSAVPGVVTESQHKAHVGPEAASNSEAVREKSAMEKELTSHIAPVQGAGEPAPTTSDSTGIQPPKTPQLTTSAPTAAAADATPISANRITAQNAVGSEASPNVAESPADSSKSSRRRSMFMKLRAKFSGGK